MCGHRLLVDHLRWLDWSHVLVRQRLGRAVVGRHLIDLLLRLYSIIGWLGRHLLVVHGLLYDLLWRRLGDIILGRL